MGEEANPVEGVVLRGVEGLVHLGDRTHGRDDAGLVVATARHVEEQPQLVAVRVLELAQLASCH